MPDTLTTAADLAARLDRHRDRIGAIARKLGMRRQGRDWLFTQAQVAQIADFLATAKPGRKPKTA